MAITKFQRLIESAAPRQIANMNALYLTTVLVLLVPLLGGVSAKDDTCPSLFERFCAKHSYCLPTNSSCDIVAYYPTQEEMDQIISLHNQYRSMIAMGTQNLPTAANMMEMEWDSELAAVAQKYANQCKYRHDHANCRQVNNFNVGQNLAIQTLSGGHTAPQPDWNFAVSIWYSEITYFQAKDIYPFDLPKGGEYRHFSQLNWATSFRIGCGYVLYKTGSELTSQVLTRLYVCNYGPAGNVYGDSMYEQGQPCYACPINSCCGTNCDYGTVYAGLCKRTNSDAPLYPAPQPNLFFCSFRGEDDCDNYIDGNSNWEITPTLGGNYLGIVLNGGENSTINFNKAIQPTPTQDAFCITLNYRKGPNTDGKEDAGQAAEVLSVLAIGYTYSQPLVSYGNPERQQFSTYNLTLSWNDTTKLGFNFAVPSGKPAQFFNIDSILITDGKCQNKAKN